MQRKIRTLIGAVVTLGFVITYALGAMVLAQGPAMQAAPPLLQGLLYVALGLAWILPLMPLIKWMVEPDR